MEKEQLMSKAWYRLLKVIYVICYLFALLIVFALAFSSQPSSWTDSFTGTTYNSGSWNTVWAVVFWGLIIVAAIFEIIRRVFLYIITGKSK